MGDVGRTSRRWTFSHRRLERSARVESTAARATFRPTVRDSWRQAMSFIDKAKEKAGELAHKAGPGAAKGIDSAKEQLDKATGGKYHDRIETVTGKVQDALKKAQGQDGSTSGGSPSDGSPSGGSRSGGAQSGDEPASGSSGPGGSTAS
jgi:hypothetical protein